MTAYPVSFDIPAPPVRHDRAQLAMRLLTLIVLAILGTPLGWLFGLAYFALPLVAAVSVSRRGAAGYLSDTADTVIKALTWLLGLYAYIALLTDRLPDWREPGVRYTVQRTGEPTIGSALWRIVTSIPEVVALWLLGCIGAVLWVVAVLFVLVSERVPPALYNYQRGLLRWQARLFAYHASLVDRYPPLAFDAGPEEAPRPA